MTRWLWWLLAYASLGIGIVGIVVPGLPTVPFVLLAAFAALALQIVDGLEKRKPDANVLGSVRRTRQPDGSRDARD